MAWPAALRVRDVEMAARGAVSALAAVPSASASIQPGGGRSQVNLVWPLTLVLGSARARVEPGRDWPASPIHLVATSGHRAAVGVPGAAQRRKAHSPSIDKPRRGVRPGRCRASAPPRACHTVPRHPPGVTAPGKDALIWQIPVAGDATTSGQDAVRWAARHGVGCRRVADAWIAHSNGNDHRATRHMVRRGDARHGPGRTRT